MSFTIVRIDRREVNACRRRDRSPRNIQISIPKTVRDHLALRPGQKMAFIAKAKGFLIVPVPKREDLVGIARGANLENYRDRNDRY